MGPNGLPCGHSAAPWNMAAMFLMDDSQCLFRNPAGAVVLGAPVFPDWQPQVS